ncbi:MAG: hypothetical protein ACPG7F_00450 [Aggregatilineales bacterium]
MFDLNTFYTLKTPAGTISDSGIVAIQQYIRMQRFTDDLWTAKNPDSSYTGSLLPALPDDWHWQWTVKGRGDYVGTFPKRISKYFYKKYEIKCPAEFLQQIGNIARQHSDDESSYLFDFTAEFNWQDGDYGDSGSCFWGGRSGAREMLAENGALAIRFYHPDKTGKARAWLFKQREGQYIIFNGYGFKSDSTLTITRVFSQFTGLSYRKVYVQNHGTDNGTLWINSGRGYMIASPDKLPDSKIEIELNWHDVNGETCNECEDSISEDDTYHDPDGVQYCRDCFYDVCDTCYDCSETAWRDDMSYVESGGYDICESCYDRNYTRCEGCDEIFHNDDIQNIKDVYCCTECAKHKPPAGLK